MDSSTDSLRRMRLVRQMAFWIGLWGSLSLPAESEAAITVEEAIAANAATLAKIDQIYLRVEISSGTKDNPLRKMSSSETWRSGTRVRTLQRLFHALTAKGMKEIPESNRVTQFSYADDESRNLRGWDPADPMDLPLDETRNPNDFGNVKAGIGPRDPQGVTSTDWAVLLLEVTPGLSLADFAKTAKLEIVEPPSEDIVRLRVVQTDHSVLSGALIDLDTAHGYLICRLEHIAAKTVADVEGFTLFGDGIWLPDKVVRTNAETRAVGQRMEARVNEPIADTDLVVAFPEGARVDEVLTKRIHLWGKDGPAHTFETFAQFLEHQEEEQRKAHPLPAPPASTGGNWLLWVNLVGIVTLLLLMALRKRLVRS